MTFSRKRDLERALKIKIRRNKQLAKQSKDHAIRFPDESREAEQKNYTKLIKRVTEEHTKHVEMITARRKKGIAI